MTLDTTFSSLLMNDRNDQGFSGFSSIGEVNVGL